MRPILCHHVHGKEPVQTIRACEKETGAVAPVPVIAWTSYFSASFFIASRMALFGSSSAAEPDWPGACGVS